ncbi:kinase-like domain-containing protein [Geopyxis carbonaria]|nr:kinase-like domain-containing protein [Geopyxis carbonaria]
MTPEGVEGEASLHDSSHNTTMTISDSSFFRERRASALPTPAEVRVHNDRSANMRGIRFNRPPPVKFQSLGLIVKYGADVTVTEVKTQIMVYKQLKGKVPVPEVFGWAQDGRQVFLYMSLIAGETLEERWGALNHEEREAVCKELNIMVKAWRSIEQPDQVSYVGAVDNQPLNDIFFKEDPDMTGPFHGADAVQKFHKASRIEIDGEVPAVFTHDDIAPPNILLSSGANPVVTAVLDWNQSGWYPGYWEFCQARLVRRFDEDMHEEWITRYLPIILDPVDDETVYHPWLYFAMSRI